MLCYILKGTTVLYREQSCSLKISQIMHLLVGYHREVLQYSLKTSLFFCILKSTQSSIEILSLTNFLFALVAQKLFFMSKMHK